MKSIQDTRFSKSYLWTRQPSSVREGLLRSAGIVKRLPISVRWSIILYAFSLPFESIDLFGGAILSLSRIAGALMVVSCVVHYRVTFSKPHPIFWCFITYLFINYIRAVVMFGDFFGGQYFGPMLVKVQLLVFAWLASEVFKDRKTLLRSFVAFAIGGIIVAAGMVLQLPGFTDQSMAQGLERVSALGNDPNVLGAVLGMATVTLIGLVLGKKTLKLHRKILLGFAGVVLPVSLLMTVSRTAMVSLVAGMSLYLLPLGSSRSLLTRANVVFICIIGMIALILQNPVSLERLSNAYYRGDSSGRDQIVIRGLSMFAEKPAVGWGPIVWELELRNDTHNLYLFLLLEGGILGATPYFAGLFLCLRRFWVCRRNDLAKIALTAFWTILVANLGVNQQNNKPMYLLMAVAVALTVTNPKVERTSVQFAPPPAPPVRVQA